MAGVERRTSRPPRRRRRRRGCAGGLEAGRADAPRRAPLGRDRRDEAAGSRPLEDVASDASPRRSSPPPSRARTRRRVLGLQGRRRARDGDGVVVTGCNIENATYGLTMCAERVALVKALSDGHASSPASPSSPTPTTRRRRAAPAASCSGSTAATSRSSSRTSSGTTATHPAVGAAAAAVRRADCSDLPVHCERR